MINKDQRQEKRSSAVDQESAEKNEMNPEDAQQDIVLTSEQAAKLKDRITRLQNEREEYLATAQRVQADFENFRRRNASVRTESIKEGTHEVLASILPVIDNIERALVQAKDKGREENDAFVQGIAMVHRQLIDVLAKYEVAEIPALGQTFDPQLHHAVMQEVSEDQEPEAILEVLQKGYQCKEKILRPVMVKVASQ